MIRARQRDQRWADVFPEIGLEPIPTERCTSEQYFALERDRIFKRVWINVGRVEELAHPLDYKLKPLPFADTSLILLRGEDGVIRGFHNVCSHRGNQVLWGSDDLYGSYGSLRRAKISCHFHGWVYNDRGDLIGVPQEERFFCLDKAANGLTPIATEVWEGFIFVNLDPAPRQSLSEFLDEEASRLAGFPYADLSSRFAYYTVLNCNWKIIMDAFVEAYHVPTVHEESFKGAFYLDFGEIGIFGPHRSCQVLQGGQHEPGPVASFSYKLATTGITKPGSRESLARLNPTGNPDFIFDLNVIFPNFLIHLCDGLYFTHQFWPLSPDKTLWEGIRYLPPPGNPGERFSQEYSNALQRDAWLEDTGTVERTHTALKSGVKKYFNLQDAEILVRHAYQVIDEYVTAE